MLWRDETQEGIDASRPQGRDGQNELAAGIEALKSTASARSLRGEANRRGQRQEGRGSREGVLPVRGERLEG